VEAQELDGTLEQAQGLDNTVEAQELDGTLEQAQELDGALEQA
jgi:hypothetical protein